MADKAKMKMTFPAHVLVKGITRGNVKCKMREIDIPLLFPTAKGKTATAFIRVVVENEEAELVAYECVLEVSGSDGKVSLQTIKKEHVPPAFMDSILAAAATDEEGAADPGHDNEDDPEVASEESEEGEE